MENKIHYLFILLISLLPLVTMGSVGFEEVNDKELYQSIGQIIDQENNNFSTSGTGFLVGEDLGAYYGVTNEHVRRDSCREACWIRFKASVDQAWVYYKLQFYKINREKFGNPDVAFFKINKGSNRQLVLPIAYRRDLINTRAFVVGFPSGMTKEKIILGDKKYVPKDFHQASGRLVISNGVIAESIQNTHTIKVTNHTRLGNSGGPLLVRSHSKWIVLGAIFQSDSQEYDYLQIGDLKRATYDHPNPNMSYFAGAVSFYAISELFQFASHYFSIAVQIENNVLWEQLKAKDLKPTISSVEVISLETPQCFGCKKIRLNFHMEINPERLFFNSLWVPAIYNFKKISSRVIEFSFQDSWILPKGFYLEYFSTTGETYFFQTQNGPEECLDGTIYNLF